MHKITNGGKVSAKFWARDDAGLIVLRRLAPGESVEADIDPDQPKFQGRGLSIKALPSTDKPKAAPQAAASPKKPAPPAPPVSDET